MHLHDSDDSGLDSSDDSGLDSSDDSGLDSSDDSGLDDSLDSRTDNSGPIDSVRRRGTLVLPSLYDLFQTGRGRIHISEKHNKRLYL